MYRNLSLDIVLGALASSLFFTRLLNQNLPLVYWILLAATVWLIYLIDHVFDSRSLQNENTSSRKLFFKKNRKLIVSLIAILFATLLSLLIFTPLKLLLIGIPGTLLIGIYLFTNQLSIKRRKFYFPRELIIAVLYLYGVSAMSILQVGKIQGTLYFYLLAYLLLILGNVLIYSFFEAKEDQTAGVQTITVLITSAKVRILNLILLSAAIGIFSFLFFFRNNFSFNAIIGIIMAVGLFAVQYFNKIFAQNKGYGIFADGLFLIPFFLLLL